MSVLLFGVSHRSAPVSVLERLSTDESDQAKILDRVLQSSLVTEAMVLSTCNRVEVYAVVEAFHGGLSVIGNVLSDISGMSLQDLTKYAYVRYAEAAVEHLFAVASGLDSAVIGEQQQPFAIEVEPAGGIDAGDVDELRQGHFTLDVQHNFATKKL